MVRRTLRVFIVATLLSLLAVPGWGQSDTGSDAYRRGDYATAYRIWKPLAEQGNASAQYNIGLMYHHGLGVNPQRKEAAKWYVRAAENGDADAQKAVGDLYVQGFWGKNDYAKAATWYRMAAEQGHAEARVSLRNLEVKRLLRPKRAVRSRTFAEAVEWYRKAAIRGNVNAQYVIGFHYAKGEGLPRDYVQAHMWWSLSAAQGHKKAAKHRDKVAKKMTPQQIDEAKRLAREWKLKKKRNIKPRRTIRPNVPIESAMLPVVGKAPPGFKFTTPPVLAPNLRFTDSTGNTLNLADFRGKVVLLNLWATWCPPCVYELPSLDRLQKKLGKSGFEVVAVSQDRGGATVVKKYFKRLGLRHLRQYLDPGRRARTRFGTTTLPTSILIDANGNERGRIAKSADWDSSAAISLIRQIRQTPATVPIKSAKAPAVDGVYGSNRGKVTLSQSGRQISGTYTCCGGGKITGTRNGNKIYYSWIQSSGSGKGVLTVSDDGLALNGTWGMGESATGGGSWNLILKAYWTKDANGCAVWNDNPRTNKAVTWSGPCVNGKAHGKGIVQFFKAGKPNGDRYVGDYRNGKAHGWGDHTWSNGDRYVGDYRNDKRHGRGVYTFSSGNRYEGEFRHSSRHGQGIFTLANGDRYEGEFRHRLWNGRFTSRDGRQRKMAKGKWVN